MSKTPTPKPGELWAATDFAFDDSDSDTHCVLLITRVNKRGFDYVGWADNGELMSHERMHIERWQEYSKACAWRKVSG